MTDSSTRPACGFSFETLQNDDLNPTDFCPACFLHGHRCLVAYHCNKVYPEGRSELVIIKCELQYDSGSRCVYLNANSNVESWIKTLREHVMDTWNYFEVAAFDLQLENECNIMDAKYWLSRSHKNNIHIVPCVVINKSDVVKYAGTLLPPRLEPNDFGYFLTQEVNILSEVNKVYADLRSRKDAFLRMPRPIGLRKEFVSPILISAANLLNDVHLSVGKKIIGTKKSGEIDYLYYYKNFVICVVRISRDDMEDDHCQVVAQMKACREAFEVSIADKMTGTKRNFKELLIERERDTYQSYEMGLPSSGVITDGHHWKFLRYKCTNYNQYFPWEVNTSYHCDIILNGTDEDLEKTLLRSVLLQLAGVLQYQKDCCDNVAWTNRFQIDELTY